MDKKITKSVKKEPEKAGKNKNLTCKNEGQENIAGYYSEEKRHNRILDVRKDLISEYADLKPKDNPSVKAMINRMAFLVVHIEEQEKIINRDGTTEEYKNGENQFGRKDSTATKVHDRMFNDFMKVKKQLDDMKPRGAGDQNPATTIFEFANQTNNEKAVSHGKQKKSC